MYWSAPQTAEGCQKPNDFSRGNRLCPSEASPEPDRHGEVAMRENEERRKQQQEEYWRQQRWAQHQAQLQAQQQAQQKK